MHLTKLAVFVAVLLALASCESANSSAQGGATHGGGGGQVKMGLPF